MAIRLVAWREYNLTIYRLAIQGDGNANRHGMRSPQEVANRHSYDRHRHDGQQQGPKPELEGRHIPILPRLPCWEDRRVVDYE